MTGKAEKPHAPNLKKDDFINAINKLSQELKDLLKPCIKIRQRRQQMQVTTIKVVFEFWRAE